MFLTDQNGCPCAWKLRAAEVTSAVENRTGQLASTRSARRRVLLLNQYFPPDTSATARLAYEVVTALAHTFDVVVLAGRPSYQPTESHGRYLWRTTSEGSFTVARVGSTAYHRRSAVGRVLNYLSYAVLAIPRAVSLRPDIVLSMSDPPFAGILGAVVAGMINRPFVYNIRDLHPDMAIRSGLLKPGTVTGIWERAHRWALRRAARVIVLGDDMRERVLRKGVASDRVAVVRDGARVGAASPEAAPEVAAQIRGDASFVALHAGNLGFYGAWETLVTAMDRTAAGVELVFVGEGAAISRVKQLAEGCGRIRFLPFFPTNQVGSMLAAADVHIVTVKHRIEGLVVPSKLYPILAAGRPVLAVAPQTSDAARIIQHWGCGLVADPDRPEEVAKALARMNADRPMLREMGRKARMAAHEFDIDRQLARFVTVVNEV